jgi:hypothetical protein
VVARKRLNVSNLPTIPSIDVLKIALPTLVPGGKSGATEKKAKNEGLRPKTAQNRVLKLDSWLAFTRLGLI